MGEKLIRETLTTTLGVRTTFLTKCTFHYARAVARAIARAEARSAGGSLLGNGSQLGNWLIFQIREFIIWGLRE